MFTFSFFTFFALVSYIDLDETSREHLSIVLGLLTFPGRKFSDIMVPVWLCTFNLLLLKLSRQYLA